MTDRTFGRTSEFVPEMSLVLPVTITAFSLLPVRQAVLSPFLAQRMRSWEFIGKVNGRLNPYWFLNGN